MLDMNNGNAGGRLESIFRDLKVGDSEGRSILTDMVLVRITDPSITYEQILEEVKKEYSHMQVKRKYLACKTEQEDGKSLLDLECAVLQMIEEVEIHTEEDEGRVVIEQWIEKILKEYYKNNSYEEVVQRAMQLGLNRAKHGIGIIISMAYKLYNDPQASEANLLQHIMDEISPETIKSWKKEYNNVPVEIVNGKEEENDVPVKNIGGIDQHQRTLAIEEFINEKIKSLVFEAARESDELRNKKTVMEIIEALLKNI